MNEEIAYLVGALRDGNFSIIPSQGIYRIRTYQKNKRWLENIAEIIEKNFGKKSGFYLDSRRNVWCLSITSKKVFQQLAEICEFDGKQSTWKTPKWILGGDIALKAAYVKGFFDAEGSINSFEHALNVAEKNVRIHLAQANEWVLQEIKEIISELGVHTGSVCGPYVKKGTKTKMYALVIHGSKEVLKFYDNTSSAHPDKVFRFELLWFAKRGNKDSSVASPRSALLLEGKVP